MAKDIEYLYSVIVQGKGTPEVMMAKYLMTRMYEQHPDFVIDVLKVLINVPQEPLES